MNPLSLYLLFLKYGLLCFGGGYMLVPLLSADLVGAPPMPLSPETFRNLLSIAQITPGPIGINTATYVGFTQYGIIGGIFATLGMATPPFILVILAVKMLKKYENSIAIQGFLSGMRPASLGFIMAAILIFSQFSIFNMALPFLKPELWSSLRINIPALVTAVISMLLISRTKIPFLLVLAAAGAAGGFFCR